MDISLSQHEGEELTKAGRIIYQRRVQVGRGPRRETPAYIAIHDL